jgi:peptidoglycan/xylan/chitin deacetylase (PgdA/CDA1 family)
MPVKFVLPMRAVVKAVVERIASASGANSLGRRRMRHRTMVLAYHNIVPDDSGGFGDRPLHLRRSDFAAQLDALLETHEVIPLTALLTPRIRARKPAAVITFDDAYTGAMTLGLDEVTARGLPATVFVAPAFVDGASFWWDAVADARFGLHPDVRTRALADLRGSDAAVRKWAAEAGIAGTGVVTAVARVAAVTEIRLAAGRPGITIGSHSWSHANLTRLSNEELEDELMKPMAWLRQHVPGAIPWLTYPYGAFNRDVAAAAARAGYDAALAVNGGWTGTPPGDRYSIPRVNIPAGISLAGFRMRAAGYGVGSSNS